MASDYVFLTALFPSQNLETHQILTAPSLIKKKPALQV